MHIPLPKTKKQWIIFGGIVAFGVLGAIMIRPKSTEEVSTVPVRRGAITEQVSATGSVVPTERIDLAFEYNGTVAVTPVRVGDRVKKGDALMVLDRREAESVASEAQAGYTVALAQLRQVTAGLKDEEIYLAELRAKNSKAEYERTIAVTKTDVATKTSDVLSARTNADASQTNLERTREKAANDLLTRLDEGLAVLRSAEAKIAEAIATTDRIKRSRFADRSLYHQYTYIDEYEKAADAADAELKAALQSANNTNAESVTRAFAAGKDAMQKTQALLEYVRFTAMEETLTRDRIPDAERTMIETQRGAVQTADNSMTTSERALETQKAANALALSTAEASFASAKDSVTTSSDRLQAAEESTKASIDRAAAAAEEADAELRIRRAKARSADVNLALAELDRAKAAFAQATTRLEKMTLRAPQDGMVTAVEADAGEFVAPGRVVVTVITELPYEIATNVSEVDVARVEVGDPVRVIFDAYPEEVFTGAVREIYPAETVVEGVIYYRAKMTFEDPEKAIRPGMTANTTIVAHEGKDVLLVPYIAIVREGGKTYVRVKKGSKIQNRPVTLGIMGDTEVEVREGVSEGEAVVTFVKK